MEFKEAVAFIFKYEGVYSNDPKDPGGETKYGISKRQFPHLDIKNLTKKHAEHLYYEHYWIKSKAQGLPKSIRLAVFDCAVNQGVRRSAMFLQKSLGIKQDGIVGSITIDNCFRVNSNELLYRFLKQRFLHYISLKNFDRFGKGWILRLIDVAINSKEGTGFHP